MPVPVEQTPTGMWLIHDPKYETASQPNPADSRTVCYARVSSGGRKGDLQRQADRLKAFAVGMGVEHPEIVTETGSGVNGNRRKLNRLLADPTVGTIIVEHRDRLARMNMGLVENALKAQGRRVVVVDDTELDDDLVRDMTEALLAKTKLAEQKEAEEKAAEEPSAEEQTVQLLQQIRDELSKQNAARN